MRFLAILAGLLAVAGAADATPTLAECKAAIAAIHALDPGNGSPGATEEMIATAKRMCAERHSYLRALPGHREEDSE